MSESGTRVPPRNISVYDDKTVKGRCRWCKGEVKPPRRTFCGENCVHEWKLRSDGAYRRKEAFKRDGGICAKCGLDCHLLERDLLKMQYVEPSKLDAELKKYGLYRWKAPDIDSRSRPSEHEVLQFRGQETEEKFTHWVPGRTLWHLDHRQEVWENGGSCGLDNLESLCWRCHRKKTAAGAKRRAERKANSPHHDLFERKKGEPVDGLFD